MTSRNLAFSLDLNGMNGKPIDEVNKKMDDLKEKGKGAGKSVDTLSDKMSKMGKGMQTTGKSLIKGVTLPLVGIGTAAIATVSSFDDSMANLSKISGEVAGETGSHFEEMREKAQELGATTAFSASEAAEGMGVLAASGMEANDVMDVSQDMFNLMSAGSIDAETSASVLTNTMAQYSDQLSDFNSVGEQSAYIVDTFAATSAKAKVSVEDLEYGMAQAGGTLASMNMDVHESTAAFGHLANAGLPAAKLGTTMNAMGREIKANAGEFKNLGIDVYDPVTGKLKTMGTVMEDLEGVVGDMTDGQRDAALSSVFSGQAMQGATAWIEQGADAYGKLTDEILKESKAAETMANIQEDTVGGAFRAMKSATEGMMIEIGDVLKKPVQEVAKFLQEMAGKFGELDGPTKEMIVKIAGIAAAIGPVLFIGGKIMTGMSAIGGIIGFVLSPVGLLVGALVGLGAGLVYLWKTNEEFKDGVIQVWEAVKDKVGSAIESIRGFWDEHGEAIIGKVTEVFDWIGEKVMSSIEWLMEFWNEHGETIVTTVTETFNRIWEIISGVFEIIMEVVSSALTWIGDFWEEHGETIKTAASTAWDLITSVIDGAMSVIQGVIDVVLGVIQGDWTRVWEGIKGIFEGVMTAISAAWNVVKDLLVAGIKGGVDAATDKFHTAIDAVKKAWEGLKTFMKNPIKGTVSAAKKGAGWVKDKFTGNSHASGAYNIPYDNYPANLHAGEMVLTSDASNQYRAMGGTENSTPVASNTTNNQSTASFSPVVNINIDGSADGDTARDIERRIREVIKSERNSFFDTLRLQQV